MLVYGDAERVESVGARQALLKTGLQELAQLPPGIERHARLTEIFIAAGELAQGLADLAFEERGFDARGNAQDAALGLVTALAHALARSWLSGFASDPPIHELLARLRFDPHLSIRTKRAEGYAFYALYPESYLEAALASGLGPDTRVIGIRSIGLGLSAIVAAALGTPPPFTVRPTGHPFRREIRVDPAVTADLVKAGDAPFAVVDEGPGLSGSSFGAVADWLETAGVTREKIHFFPSHSGDLGPQASQIHRERWSGTIRHTIDMDRLLLKPSECRSLRAWIEEAVGPLDGPIDDLSGGAWRARRYPCEKAWPAADIRQERRKFLGCAGGVPWLAKFIGLDGSGARKIERARLLHEAGYTPEIAGHRYGFLVERWHGEAPSLDCVAFDRARLVERVGSYLAFRVRHFPSARGAGASSAQLRRMTLYNTGEALGQVVAEALARVMPSGEHLDRRMRRTDTDNRMHAWEWLVLDGRLLKTDALDHSSGHDLVGHQDIAWDIAGAIVELSLSSNETDRLCTIIEREGGHPVDPQILAFLYPCYLAFQMGASLMAAHALGEGPEADRLRRQARRYARPLKERPSVRAYAAPFIST